ncbi:putative germin-like protein 2-1 [Zostera marina]|uniref:Germin-like protein n=1 Tax=Zostera marina TaxID=29655 RepID=A0A0K9P8L1_ZOSMR|nr:putative germin-like protein 2-1 [Zostera marina]
MTMDSKLVILIFAVAMAIASSAMASDPSPLQDFCVADHASKVLVNGLVCKNPKYVTEKDFFFSGLDKANNSKSRVGSIVTPVNVVHIPGLNTLGISLVRIDFQPGGLNPPHTHPRATELLTVLEGTLGVGFVTSNSENRFISKVLKKGDVFTFPIGLIHFQINLGKDPVVAIAALSSQNPGVITIADALFGSKPPIDVNVLTKAFSLDKDVVEYLQDEFSD